MKRKRNFKYKPQKGWVDGSWYAAGTLMKSKGYKVHEVYTSSSAGDWAFVVSKNGRHWRVMEQENAYPRSGFRWYLGEERFVGTLEEVLNEININLGD